MFQQFQKQSFWRVLESGYRIVIPAIQRDYAQGRTDEKVKAMRDLFLDALISALTDEKPLVLDFIYGIEETDSAAGKCLIPIDGQQRLTTLYLLHTYILAMMQEDNSKARELLGGFQYAARESTQDFCAAWIKGAATAIQTAADGSLYDTVCNQTWFARSWLQDPTVASMLIMLDAIHGNKGKLQDALKIWKRLTQGEAIQFMFLDLNKEGLQADELYIRMNARGRLLQPFEHFKAFLLDKCVPKDDKNDWGKLLDGDWSELFWKHRNAFQENKNSPAQDNDYDNEWMQAFRGFALISAGLSTQNQELISRLNDSTVYIAFDTYRQLLGPEFLNEIKTWLNAWHKLDEKIKSDRAYSDWTFDNSGGVFESFLSQRSGLKTIARFYAASLFLAINDPFDAPAFCSWMRVIRNWTEAFQISTNNFSSVLQQIKLLAKAGSGNIYRYLTAAEYVPLVTIGKEQMEEERRKTPWLLGDLVGSENKEFLLNELEHSPYLKGNISVLLPDDWETMVKRAETFGAIFGKVDDSLIIRAMLSQEEYWINYKSYYYFGGGQNGWRTLLNSRDSKTASDVGKAICGLLDNCYALENASLLVKMEELCKAYTNSSTIKDWRYYFIKYPMMTQKMQDDERAYYWDWGDFHIRAASTIKAYHTNPYALTALHHAGLSPLPSHWRNSVTIDRNQAPIGPKNGVEIWPDTKGWRIILPKDQSEVVKDITAWPGLERAKKNDELLLRTTAEDAPEEGAHDESADRIEAIRPLLRWLAGLSPDALNITT